MSVWCPRFAVELQVLRLAECRRLERPPNASCYGLDRRLRWSVADFVAVQIQSDQNLLAVIAGRMDSDQSQMMVVELEDAGRILLTAVGLAAFRMDSVQKRTGPRRYHRTGWSSRSQQLLQLHHQTVTDCSVARQSGQTETAWCSKRLAPQREMHWSQAVLSGQS